MDELVKKQDREPATPGNVDLSLGQWMGRREAFGLMAGRCSAADIEILQRIRDEKLYTSLECTWEEFCTRHLHVSRRSAEREIGYLRDYGPAFFTVRQLTHVSAREYRQIAPHVSADGVHLEGAVIPIDPQNSEPLAAAVEKLLEKRPARQAKSEPFDAVLKRCQEAHKAVRKYKGGLVSAQLDELVDEVEKLRRATVYLDRKVVDR